MKIGVTGTRNGMTESQRRGVRLVLEGYHRIRSGSAELHHGDCVGADVQVAEIARELGFKIVCHPPVIEDLRGYFASEETRPPYTYFKRNRNIVDETSVLLVVPLTAEHQNRGGTWYTHDYGLKQGNIVVVFRPQGGFSITEKNSWKVSSAGPGRALKAM